MHLKVFLPLNKEQRNRKTALNIEKPLMEEDWLFYMLAIAQIIKMLTIDFDFLHNFTCLIVHFYFDRNGISVIVELKGSK